MRLISCHVENFGKLQNVNICFETGKNAIHEENGFGKSTLAAFIRVMFYGFNGDGKRGELENERKRYKPWQMGVYGGSICFEAGGKEYRAERRFGEKKTGTDSFVLYDLTTNLRCEDYSQNLGEEIFGIDVDSFQKTVFIAQQDCGTGITPGISAKIGNIADQTADLGNFDSVQARLKKELDGLNPDRSTGLINKLDREIAERKERVRRKEHVQNNLQVLTKNKKDLEEERERKLAEQGLLQEQMARLSEQKDLLARVERYREILGQEDEARREYDEVRALFPGEVPSQSEIEDRLSRMEECEDHEQSERNHELTGEEEQKLRALEEKFEGGVPDEASLKEMEGIIRDWKEKKAECESLKMSENEKKRLLEAEVAFREYLPTREEIDEISALWSERRSKKEALPAKKSNAELARNMVEEKRERRNREERNKRRTKNGCLLLGAVLALTGILIFLLMHNLILTGILVAMGICLAVIGVCVPGRRTADLGGDLGEEGCLLLERAVEEDEEFLQSSLERCRDFFDGVGMPFEEYDVLGQLSRLRSNLKDYEELLERREREKNPQLEQRIMEAEQRIHRFFEQYKVTAMPDDPQRSYYELKEWRADFIRLSEKKRRRDEARERALLIRDKVRAYLGEIGVEDSDDLKQTLMDLRDASIRLKGLGESLSQKQERRKGFEEENDMERIRVAMQEVLAKEGDASETMALETHGMEELNGQFTKLQKEIDGLSGDLHQFQIQIEDLLERSGEAEEQENALQDLTERREEAWKRYQVISKTKAYLEKAKEQFSSRYVKVIQDAFVRYHDMISGSEEKYELDANLNLSLREKGSLHDLGFLSEGYQDLVGLCRRMAMVDAMYEQEKPFLILDDPFVNLDEDRLAGALNFLDQISKRYQVIYFTCHDSRLPR